MFAQDLFFGTMTLFEYLRLDFVCILVFEFYDFRFTGLGLSEQIMFILLFWHTICMSSIIMKCLKKTC